MTLTSGRACSCPTKRTSSFGDRLIAALAAVLCCVLSTTVFTACGDDEITYTDSYRYKVEIASSLLHFDFNEYKTVQEAFDRAVGDVGGTVNKVYSTPQDESMKSKCEAVKSQYANIKSTYMKFNLCRIKSSTDPNIADTGEIIATYELGQATVKPYMEYAFISNGTEAYETLQAMKDTVDEKVYAASLKTFKTLVGVHNSYDGTDTNGMTSAFEHHFRDEFSRPWEDLADYDRYVVYACDSIANAHADDTLIVDIKVAAIKTGFLNRQVTTIWEKVFPANFQ